MILRAVFVTLPFREWGVGNVHRVADNVIGVSEGSIFEYVRAAFAYTVLCADFFQSAESILRKKNRSKPTRKTN